MRLVSNLLPSLPVIECVKDVTYLKSCVAMAQ